MSRAHPRPASAGATLLELLTALALAATLLAAVAAPIVPALDRLAATAARDAVAGALARTRALAQARGGGTLVLAPAADRVWLEVGAGGALPPPLDLGREFGVDLSVGGSAPDTIRLRWDAYGIGRMASRTILLRRGRAEARLTVSTYGRVRKW